MKANLTKNKITIAGLITLLSLTTACFDNGKVEQSEADTNLIVGLLAGQEQGRNSEAGKDFILNGTWNSFTGNATTSTTIATIKAKRGKNGIFLSDGTTFTSHSLIVDFDNSGSYITQNPENGGAFTSFTDNNKGKFFKVVFFQNTEKTNSYWYCTVNGSSAADSIDEAKNVVDNTNRTNPGTTGCGGNFAWSRIDRR